jgi:hypothetical protein
LGAGQICALGSIKRSGTNRLRVGPGQLAVTEKRQPPIRGRQGIVFD